MSLYTPRARGDPVSAVPADFRTHYSVSRTRFASYEVYAPARST